MSPIATRALGWFVTFLGLVALGAGLSTMLCDVLSRVISEGIRLGYVHTSDPKMTAYLLNLAAATALANAIASHDDEMLERVVAQTKELYIKVLAPLDDPREIHH